MTYSTDIIAHVCYTAFLEAFLGYKQMIYLYETPKYLIENVIFNFGDIYSNMRDFTLFFTGDERGTVEIPYEAGQLLGNSFYLIFEPVNNATWNTGDDSEDDDDPSDFDDSNE
jgi:hypothetical protein